MFDKTDQMAVDTIRTLSIDGVQKANSGHPGLPMGAAPMAYTLWTRHLNANPKNSKWFNRDRFILSAGHGSMLLYSLLHLSGYDVTIEDLKNFRQFNSRTPGHPEVHITDGVEATTGPLGQGVANAVGMAMAEAHLAATYNKDDYNLVDHYTYALCGDGDLMEGVSQEAASLAGHLQLGKLIMLYDSNDISLDGPTSMAFTEDVGKRFEAYGWEHILVEDGNDLEAIDQAITAAKQTTDKPTLIEIKTIIGFGAPNAGTHTVHGAPLGTEGVTATKEAYGWEGEDFFVPEAVAARFKEYMVEKGSKAEEEWNNLLDSYKSAHAESAEKFELALSGELPEDWDRNLPVYTEGDKAAATRATSGEVLNALSQSIPNLWGGSADLSGSNNTMMKEQTDFQPGQYAGRNIWYGVREFAMTAALNGILLHGGTKSYVGTFFVFSDYLRPAVRLAALSEIPAIYVLTHDSIAVGEDGPTHEPVEQLSSFRGMHNLSVIRPADGNEVAAAWEIALKSTDRPTMLVLTRQGLPVLPNSASLAREQVKKGAYVISPADKETPEGILIATGSEVSLAIEAQKALKEQGKDVSVVSMPSQDLFEQQSKEYKESVLPADVLSRVTIEMGSSFGWDRYAGPKGAMLSIDKFGASGNGTEVVKQYGFTKDNIVKTYLSLG
ncbi:transketolase [Marinilactibacillus piezotolerans]|uniref:transketolase n=1 Tax=Marinilactibacillus piezotolerans TaxID=258723 RepID=UPI0009AF8D2E|nr:transketolase [Marinilactibacillus piezotolerans]